MIRRINKTELVGRLAARSVALDAELMSVVGSIVDDVRARGDEALIDYTARFDKVELKQIRVSDKELRRCAAGVDERVRRALREAIENVREFHERQVEESWTINPRAGVQLGQRITPLEIVGLYVPGGTAAYPSSVVMNVVPAQVAGVERIVITTPPRTLADSPAVAAALLELNVNEVYAVGGAQAIAALAFGTETVPRVDKITGPGNKYVAAAKKIVFGVVGIDAIAGPTEVVIVADETAHADFIAADLLAQAEHGVDASAVLITTNESLARGVAEEVERQMESLPRREIVEASLRDCGAIVLVETLAEACALVNELAPEHVEIVTKDDEEIAEQIRHAGAIFFGSYTPEAVGDYLAGPNHVLPTSRTARFSSALGVYDFVKRTSLLRYEEEAFARAAESVAVLAECEGLSAHARSALIRKEVLTRRRNDATETQPHCAAAPPREKGSL
ncbi:MAG TPA: histidinol dehydrogenase [Pyrinomonadaceae bacterium]|nr:histidinol dehydrogenase [Pyrinomonadaceae bacterium]